MIVMEKSGVKPSEIGCFPDLEALWSTFPRNTRLHMERVGKYANAMYRYMADKNLENVNDILGEDFQEVSRQIFFSS